MTFYLLVKRCIFIDVLMILKSFSHRGHRGTEEEIFWVLILWVGGIGFWGLDLRELNHGEQVEPRRKRF